MGFLDFVLFMILLVLLAIGGIFLYLNFPSEDIEFEDYKANISRVFPQQSTQFYFNMRYPDREISYNFGKECSTRKQRDFESAIEILEEKTILSFYKSTSPEINVSCSNLEPKPNEQGHFIAGEGGPTLIINATNYAVILSGSIALYRQETCDKPQVAIHEILHALGFDHNSNEKSIMFPITACDQEIDQYIIDEITRLYSQPSLADLIIEKVEANKSGRYLNLVIVFANHGLKDVENASIDVYTEDSPIKSLETGSIEIGAKKILTLTNLRMPRGTDEITVLISTLDNEITKTNNIAVVRALE